MTMTPIIKTFGASALLALGLLGGAATIAAADQHSSSNDAAEAQAFLAAPGTIGDAIKAAEANTGGKAMSASFESDGTTAGMYEVEIVKPDGTMMTAIVNPADGSVTAKPASATDDDQNGEDSGTGENGEANESN